MKRFIKRTACLLTALLTLGASLFTVFASAQESERVEKISFNNPGFIKGVDVSSVISLEKSGVVFRDQSGRARDIFDLLSENGVNYIRVRVWNNPYSSDGKGYGGGNCDVKNAAEIGRRAARCGMKLLVDFHYSDFWADPSKQTAPKEWAGLDLDELCDRVKSFTAESLGQIKNAGADVGMVQIGNETTSGIAGVWDWKQMPAVFAAGAQAVREFDENTLVALHFTNPEKSDTMKWFASQLDAYKADYDVFAASYYPCWHGSLENLSSVLGFVAKTYDKYVMVAENSYPYTLADSDGFANTISPGSNDSGEDMKWSFTPEGQAREIYEVMSAVNKVGEKGIGYFYWEGAWITVGDVTGLSGEEFERQRQENSALWESLGSGWAASASAEYDPWDAGKYYGGSAVDNQALFAPDGSALSSLSVFGDVDGKTKVLLGDADSNGEITIRDATEIQRFAASIVTFDAQKRAASDVNGDGGVTVGDATLIQKYIADIKTDYPIGQYREL